MSWVAIQSKRALSQPQLRSDRWMPSAGLNIHCQITPQATNDMENEYR